MMEGIRTYIITFNPYFTNEREHVMDALVAHGLRDWMSEVSSYVILKTTKNADEIREIILPRMQGRFLVAEIGCNRNGMHTKKMWNMLEESKNYEVVRKRLKPAAEVSQSDVVEEHFAGDGNLNSE